MSRQTSVSRSASSGIGLTGLLTIVFIVLKLLNVINWNWWWVLSPLWIDACFVILILLGIFLWTNFLQTIILVKKGKRNKGKRNAK